MSQLSWDIYFLNLAKEISTKSKDPSLKCGCVLVAKDNSVISTGYNGLPQCLPDLNEYLYNRDIKLQIILHAEENALAFVDNRERLIDATVYTYPLPSCAKCVSQCLQRKVKRFVGPDIEYSDRWKSSVELGKEIILKSKGDKIWDTISVK